MRLYEATGLTAQAKLKTVAKRYLELHQQAMNNEPLKPIDIQKVTMDMIHGVLDALEIPKIKLDGKDRA